MGQVSLEHGFVFPEVPVGLRGWRSEQTQDLVENTGSVADYALPQIELQWALSDPVEVLVTDKSRRKEWTDGLWDQAWPLIEAGYSVAEVVDSWDGPHVLKTAARRSFVARQNYYEALELVENPAAYGSWGDLFRTRVAQKHLKVDKKTFALMGLARSLLAERRQAMGVIQSDYEDRELDSQVLFSQLEAAGQLTLNLEREELGTQSKVTSRKRRERAWLDQLSRLPLGRRIIAISTLPASALSAATLHVWMNWEPYRRAVEVGEPVGLFVQAFLKIFG